MMLAFARYRQKLARRLGRFRMHVAGIGGESMHCSTAGVASTDRVVARGFYIFQSPGDKVCIQSRDVQGRTMGVRDLVGIAKR